MENYKQELQQLKKELNDRIDVVINKINTPKSIDELAKEFAQFFFNSEDDELKMSEIFKKFITENKSEITEALKNLLE